MTEHPQTGLEPPDADPAPNAARVRDRLCAALRLDMVGPDTRPDAHDAHMANTEILPPKVKPSSFYLFGHLTPADGSGQSTGQEDSDELQALFAEQAAEAQDDANSAAMDDEDGGRDQVQPVRLQPSSIGLTVTVEPDCPFIDVTIRYADYLAEPPIPDDILQGANKSAGEIVWHRKPNTVSHRLTAADLKRAHDTPSGIEIQLPETVSPQRRGGCLELHVFAHDNKLPRPVEPWPLGLTVTVFVVNKRDAAVRFRDVSNVFQVNLQLQTTAGFIGNPDMSGFYSDDMDLRLHDLHYHDVLRYAGGRNVGTGHVPTGAETTPSVWSDPLPACQVEKVDQNKDLEKVTELNMQALAELTETPDLLGEKLARFPADYLANFIARQDELARGMSIDRRREIAESLVSNQRAAARRMQEGINLLRNSKAAQKAFAAMNIAIKSYLEQTRKIPNPAWRPFQLAFILLNLAGQSDKQHPDRHIVDLLFFPTGGGKTEAYLGLAAYQIAHRRLSHRDWLGSGVSVIMRYTLRLLTLDQLGRAAAMICALEKMRRSKAWQDDKGFPLLGPAPIEIGLWVGSGATPNRIGGKGKKDTSPPRNAYGIVNRYRSSNGDSPAPITACPWCGEAFDRNTFQVTGDRMHINCQNLDCDFRASRGGLPVLAVDEEIYNRLPAFIVATVDKFAALPRRGEVGRFFDNVDRLEHADQDCRNLKFYGADLPGVGKLIDRELRECLPPPDLIIQDELHLISGPLGTIAGLYEAAIDRLASRRINGELRGPKIIASTATVRRAEDQIRRLFGRDQTAIFPPPGIDRRDSHFARVGNDRDRQRRYVGVSALGIGPRKVFLRSVVPLLATAQREFQLSELDGGQSPADPYMTALCYFNALRELGATRRIVEDEVATNLQSWPYRRARDGQAPSTSPFARRSISPPQELTSRDSTDAVAKTKERLAQSFVKKPAKGAIQPLDVALATNMISVGLDITRLGLMIVQNQPKSAAEYIQSTSRVGRDDTKPGLVLVILNMHRARDRTHYEDFEFYHHAFYRAVEATSVTPGSRRAQDRALGAVFAALVRHLESSWTRQDAAARFDPGADVVKEAKAFLVERIGGGNEQAMQACAAHIDQLVKGWQSIIEDRDGEPLHWDCNTADDSGLMHNSLENLSEISDAFELFKAGWSMRDVQPGVELEVKEYLERQSS